MNNNAGPSVKPVFDKFNSIKLVLVFKPLNNFLNVSRGILVKFGSFSATCFAVFSGSVILSGSGGKIFFGLVDLTIDSNLSPNGCPLFNIDASY
ncbi:hypothetical protein DERP_011446 [Dermatophagoides pteronyssinus]|uniref:Uncharacterized protein n=1 Tax=Dermatophagoides pteronyssinus TaxID=6956 RepID=A0ABQ8J5T9_DERPT|nr:hypothetical protein DERP_011446 [Dermatophagoides pteronyssinus]